MFSLGDCVTEINPIDVTRSVTQSESFMDNDISQSTDIPMMKIQGSMMNAPNPDTAQEVLFQDPIEKQPFYTLDSNFTINHDIRFHEFNESAHSVKISPNSMYRALGTLEGNVRIFQMASTNQIFSMRDKDNPKDTVTAFQWRPRDPNKTENVLAASYTSNKIIHWLSTTGKRLTVVDTGDVGTNDIDYFSDAEKFAVGCSDGTVRVYNDIKRTKALDMDVSKKHGNTVLAVKCCDDLIVSAGWDNNLKIWDSKSGNQIENIHVPTPYKDALDFDGNYIILGNFDRENHLKVWDIRMADKMVSETTLKSVHALDPSFKPTD
jgi:WD40 repeat protein